MSRNSAVSQTKRNFQNPLVLGTFSTTSLRYLKGTLKQEYKLIGSADTNSTSNGGYAGGTYNHWFQINLAKPAWIIVTKGPPRPNYIQVSTYDLNRTPILALPIFDADSITDGINRVGSVYIPYLDTVMNGQSDLYNTYSRSRLDRGDDRYYPLGEGSYLLCISSTRNEPLDYAVGIVIEFPPTELFIGLEDEEEAAILLQETSIDFTRTISVPCPVTTDLTISTVPGKPNGFSAQLCQIDPGVTVTVLEDSTWLIGEEIPTSVNQGPEYGILAEPVSDDFLDTIHDHSLSEWRQAWNSQHQETDRFPEIFAPLTNRV
jgi:hypothetical protein